MRLHHEGTNPAEPALKDPAVRALVWCLLELTITDAGHEPYSWREILRSLSQEEPARVARMAAAALASSELILQQHAEKLLTELAGELPEVVMSELGAIMLDSERGMHFHIAVHRGLISALPPKTVIAWLEEHGVEAARRVGRHLPLPHLGPGGKPVVPPLTEFVLTRFEDDDWTFSEFCAGVHSFQTYTGDIARQHEQEAELARRFLGHQARRVREWAGGEMQQARSEAQRAREREEEFGID